MPSSRKAHLVSVALKIVVKGQLFASSHVFEGIQANCQLAMHDPLLRLAVWVAGVVDETAQSTLQQRD